MNIHPKNPFEKVVKQLNLYPGFQVGIGNSLGQFKKNTIRFVANQAEGLTMSYKCFTTYLLTLFLSVNLLGGEGGGSSTDGDECAVDISSTEFSN